MSIGYRHKAEVVEVAKDLSLALQAGEFVCLLGPNGAGKSTLIRTLSGMQQALSGRVCLGAQDYHLIAPRERAKQVSVVLTETMPIGMMDVYSLVALGRHPYSGWLGGLNRHDRERIAWALQAVGADVLAERQVSELSDGERQKVSIARALAQEAKVMLLDEPTAYLDLPRRVELMTILRELAHREQMGLLLSTHDLELALRFADKLWVMTADGQLLQGAPEVLALSGEFASVFANENLEWDAGRGLFRAPLIPCLQVLIKGDGDRALWTRRAMERLGFGVTADEAFALCIEVTAQAWLVTRAGADTIVVGSIAELIDWVQAEDWA
ncbi:ABC transporter ATP-binding protein [Coraliomargarita akajimensis]|nr:ABC transporter ATP-binding protein [Coraliomargarita akajimensis]